MQVSEALRRGLALLCRRPCPGPGGPASSPGSARTRGTPRHAPARPVLWRRSLSPLIQKGSGVLPVLTGLRSLGWSLRSALPDPSAPVGSPRPPETHHRLRHWCPRDACGSHHLPRLSISSLCAPHPQPAARILAFPPLRCLSNPSLRLSVPVPVASLRAASAVACRLVHLPPLHPQALLQPPVHGSAA